MAKAHAPKKPPIPPHLHAAPGWPIHPALVTSAFDIPGHRITASFGIVRGLIVRSAGFGGGIAATFEALGGGNVQTLIDMCERARNDAFLSMSRQAAHLGANAIVAFRYDTTEIGQGMTEVLAYGTAVWATPTTKSDNRSD